MPRIRLKNGEELDYVDWANDPRHKLLFENRHTKVYQIQFKPGSAADATLIHCHTADTVAVCIDDAGPGGEAYNEELREGVLLPPRRVQTRSGMCFCRMSGLEPYIHRVSVAAGNPQGMRYVSAEIFEAACIGNGAGLAGQPCYTLEAEQPGFRVWRLALISNERECRSTGMHIWNFSGVVINLTNTQHLIATEQSPFKHQLPEALRQGGAFWFDGPVQHELSVTRPDGHSSNDGKVEAVIIEWR